LEKIATLTQEKDTYLSDYTTAENNIHKYETKYNTLQTQFEYWQDRKIDLNNAFYSRYARFIYEGTWIDESYMDDNLYYTNALSVAYNSSMPKVSYSINVIMLAGIPGYELFDFKIGD
jgi:hypothetical protein